MEESKYKPLLVVKIPIGKMTRDKAFKYIQNTRDDMMEAFNHEYNLVAVGTRNEDWDIEGFFADDDTKILFEEEAKIQLEKFKKQLEE